MEGSDSVTKVISYDGQTIWMEGKIPLYEVGNFLGGGAAGTVYEAEHVKTKEHFALKILNPLGYKLISPALLRRCSVISKGKPVPEAAERAKDPLLLEHVWWLHNSSTKQYLAAYYSERQRALNELSLVQCMNIWGTNPPPAPVSPGRDLVNIKGSPGSPAAHMPTVPPKYADFVKRRGRIFREIRNMRNISAHINVIRLENVLELAQDSKCTIFLVMELANGGELFDRIKIDCGTREKTAKKFFLQLLSGVRHCHDEGVCHRDLKPENLLLQDIASVPDGSILKIADFGFSARLAMATEDEVPWDPTNPHGSLSINGNIPPPGSPMVVLRSVVGSPFYVAPEVLQAQGYDGRKADVWSIGVILYAMLAGNLPFAQELSTCKRFKQFGLWAAEMTAKNPRFWEDVNLQCPPWLFSSKFSALTRSIIVGMLMPDPSLRISVEECQQHSWCQPEDGVTVAVPAPSTATASTSALGVALAAPVSQTASPVVAAEVLPISPAAPAAVPVVIAQPVPHVVKCNHDDMEQSETELPHGDEDLDLDLDVDVGDEDDEGDDDEDGGTMEEEQFVMDGFSDEDEGGGSSGSGRQGVAFKKSKKSPRSHLYDPSTGLSGDLRGVSQSLFSDDTTGVVSPPIPPATPPASDSTISRSMEFAFRRVSMEEDEEDASPAKPAPPPRSPYRTTDRNKGSSTTEYTQRPARRSFTTPPPIPSNAVPYIVAGTPDLISDDMYGIVGMPYSPQDGIDQSLRPAGSPALTGVGVYERSQYPPQPSNPPSFHDAVKRSTRFITSVPAGEVLETVESILEQCRLHRTPSPIGHIGRVEMHWDSYRLDVWGVHDVGSSSPPLCSLHLYQLPNSTPPASPARDLSLMGGTDTSSLFGPSSMSSSYGASGRGQQQLYLVEFVRGQLEIFQFKRFYEWVRQKVSELVKRDYAFNCFDQASSPIVLSSLGTSPQAGHGGAGGGLSRRGN